MSKFVIDIDYFKELFEADGKYYLPDNDKSAQVLPVVTNETQKKSQIENKELEFIGTFLCMVENKTPIKQTPDYRIGLFNDLFKGTENKVQLDCAENEDLYIKIFKDLFLNESGYFLSKGIKCLEHNYKISNRYAKYLFSMIDNVDIFKSAISCNDDEQISIINKFVYNKFKFSSKTFSQDYKKIINFLDEPFAEDFAFVMSSPERKSKYLGELLNLYLFLYVIYSFLQLSRFDRGYRSIYGKNKNENINVLYFCMDTESGLGNRKAVDEYNGFHKIEKKLHNVLAYNTLFKIINLNRESVVYDFIDIKENIDNKIWNEDDVIEQFHSFYVFFLDALKCDSLEHNLKWDNLHEAIQNVFNLICFWINSTKASPQSRMRNNLMNDVFRHYIKVRGQHGNTLNIRTDQLIMLTNIVIKDNEKGLRLNDVFKEFQRRGIFFDDISKQVIADFYDVYNLNEKKSDCGDAQYVRRII